MPKLKILSAEATVKIYESFGFFVERAKGSHVRLVRILPDGSKQKLTIPNHKTLKKGTLASIYRKSTQYISEEELTKYFYTD
jgi:predicted RNA binding protein YcfA (HicA-like mRNA interferase family)